MAGAAEMKLVFRLEKIGFSLPVSLLVEVVELDQKPRVSRKKDASPYPQVEFRGEAIPVVDLSGCFGLPASKSGTRSMLVLYGELGFWGGVVDTVEGIRPAAEFAECGLSPLFALGEGTLYDKIDIWRSEPLIQLVPDRLEPQEAGS